MEIPLSPSTLERELCTALLASEKVPTKKEYKCHECGSLYTDYHADQVHSQRNHQFECDQCHFSFVGKIYLKTHKFDDHGESDNNKCSICEKTFVNLQKHLRTHTPNNAPNNVSSVAKNYSDIEEYKDNLRPYLCDQCGSSFKTANWLTRHRRKEHGGYISP
jgi:DNA-directed RNA polymerase subunit RPC12/RpoP